MTELAARDTEGVREHFWASVARNAMELQRCRRCGGWRYPPSRRCPECWHPEWEWRQPGGGGRVVSSVTFHRAYDPRYAGHLPYVVAVVELDEGPRLVTRITAGPGDTNRVGARVALGYEPSVDGRMLPVFAPDPAAR